MNAHNVNHCAEAANQSPPLSGYLVQIMRGREVVKEFEALAADSCSCVMQHEGLCREGEKIDVRPLADVSGK